MIIRDLRYRAPVYLSALLLLMGIALVARATQPVTQSEMRSFVYETIAAAAVLVVGAFWILLTTINGRTERTLTEAVNRLESAVQKLIVGLEAHNSDPLAHSAASEHNHSPMNDKLDLMDERQQKIHDIVLGLKAEHDLIRSEEDELCAILRRRKEEPRRKSDPEGFDASKERGNK